MRTLLAVLVAFPLTACLTGDNLEDPDQAAAIQDDDDDLPDHELAPDPTLDERYPDDDLPALEGTPPRQLPDGTLPPLRRTTSADPLDRAAVGFEQAEHRRPELAPAPNGG